MLGQGKEADSEVCTLVRPGAGCDVGGLHQAATVQDATPVAWGVAARCVRPVIF